MPVYEVRTMSGVWYKFNAENSQDAKRQCCKFLGRKPSDPWTGMSSLEARKMSDK